MNEITFFFRPMADLKAELCEAQISIANEFVCIDAIPGHPIHITGPVAHIVSNALRDARNELRNVEVLK